MRAFRNIVWVQLKLLVREPPAFFFTLIFPSLLLVFFGGIFGNELSEVSVREWGYVDRQVSALAGLIIGTTGLLGIPVTTAVRRESGTLRRYRATPLSPFAYMAADVATYYLMTLAGVLLLVVLAKVAFDVRFGGTWLLVLAAFTLSALAFFATGYILASLAPTGRTAQAVGQAIFFPMMFLAGAAVPREIMPRAMRAIGEYLPLTHVILLLRGVWFGEPLADHAKELVILGLMLVIGFVVSVRVFRWE